MKYAIRSVGARKLFVLISYLLLSYGALIYASLITLNLDYKWQNNSLIAEVPRDLSDASLFLDFRSVQPGNYIVKIKSGGATIFDGLMAIEHSSDLKNYLLLKKTPRIDKGPLEIDFDRPIDLLEVRAEYRYSALRYYRDAIAKGDSRALWLLFCWILTFVIGILLWKYGLKIQLLVLVASAHLFFLWMVFSPMSGYDDTYHLPGAALMTTSLSRDEIRLQTVKLIKDSNYMLIRRVPRAVTKELSEKEDFCPHALSFSDLTIDTCPFGEDFNLMIYSQFLKPFGLQNVASVEVGLKIVNQIVFFLSVLTLGLAFSLLFDLAFSQGFMFMLAASLTFFPLVPQTMTTGHDLLFFLISSVGLWLVAKLWKSQNNVAKVVCLLLSFVIVTPFILNAQVNNKTYLIFVVPLLTLFCFLAATFRSRSQAASRTQLVWLAIALSSLLPICWYLWKSIVSFYSGVLFPFLTGNMNLEPFALLSAPKVLELALEELIGSVISGKIYPPSPVKAFYLFLLIGLCVSGFRRFYHRDKFITGVMAFLFLGVFGILLALGGLTLRDVWISLRFSYALVPVYWFLYAAGFLESKDFDAAPALVALIAVNTIYLPAFVFPLLN